MTISYIGSSTATGGGTITIPAHQSGDYIIISSVKKTSEMPTVNAAFTLISANTSANLGISVGYKVATSNATVSGDWDATNLLCAVYRGVTAIGNTKTKNGNSAMAIWGGVTLPNTGTSWVAGTGAGKNSLIDTPTGMTKRANLTSVDRQSSLIDTNAGVTTFFDKYSNVVSGVWRTVTYELKG